MLKDKITILIYTILLAILLGILSLVTLNPIYKDFEENRRRSVQNHLKQNLEKAVSKFESEIDRYALLVSGLRSHMLQNDRPPLPEETQKFIFDQLSPMDYAHSLIVNYFDTTHTFIFTVSEKEVKVNDFVGAKLQQIRDPATVERMNLLLQSPGLMAFPPINLYEGFVGLPIDYRLEIGGKIVGYIAPLIDIKNILDPILELDNDAEFTYRFAYGSGIEFDREAVYNGTEAQHDRLDSMNYHLPVNEYLNQSLTKYNLPFTIGIAYKSPNESSSLMPFMRASYSIIIILIFLSALLIFFFLKLLSRTKELDKTNRELTSVNSFLKKFIYASSHDLKQPLVNISNFQNLLKKKYHNELDGPGKKYLNIIADNIQFMNQLLDDLLIYSQIIRQAKNKERVDVTLILDELNDNIDSNKVSLKYGSLPSIYGVTSEIKRLFQNLISNSIKFNTNELVQVEVTAVQQKEHVQFIVADNGIGIEEEHLDLIFEEFQRLRKKEYPGSGLGLSICKEIVRNHDGTIIAKSNAPSGTQFIFQLRRHDF